MNKEQINSRVLAAVGVVLDTHKELTKTAIAKLLGIKPSTFTEILKGRMKASSDLEYAANRDALTGRNR